MVQMKAELPIQPQYYPVSFISHMVQMKVCKKSENNEGKAQLYIPHGSDERVRQATLFHPNRYPLYPTWFR